MQTKMYKSKRDVLWKKLKKAVKEIYIRIVKGM